MPYTTDANALQAKSGTTASAANFGAGTIRASLRSKKVSLANPKSVEGRDLSGYFAEHTWDILRLQANHPDSHIDVKQPALSKGLSVSRAAELLLKFGLNELPEPKEISSFELFVKQFWNLLWALLIGASTLSLFQFFLDTSDLVNLWITLILYGMILVMCTVSWWQEKEARKAVRAFKKLMPDKCLVVRDGMETLIFAHDIVAGDLIRIRSGARVPADARIIACTQLKLESSSITGEAEPIDYQWEAVAENVSIFESRNVAFSGSLCVEGEGLAVVIRVGTSTVIGQIADLTTGQGGKKSRLEKQVGKYVKFLVVLALSVGILAFVIGGFVHKWKNVLSLFTNGLLVCAIGMVPCGLPATVTSLLTMNARRMANKNVYLKRLDICEALGQVNIIASDKTGTLTKNVMTVTDLWYLDHVVDGAPKPQNNDREKSPDSYESPVGNMLTQMVVCNAATFVKELDGGGGVLNGGFIASTTSSIINIATLEKGKRVAIAERHRAMLNYAERLVDIQQLRDQHNVVFEIPFNSRRKWHMRIVKLRDLKGDPAATADGEHGGGSSSGGQEDEADDAEQHGQTTTKMAEYLLMMKGASELLATRCSRILDRHDHALDFDEAARKAFQRAYDRFADSGKRVIGFAQVVFTAPASVVFKAEQENFPTSGLTFLGACAIMDPPRDESAAAIRQCYQAGIKVFMVTGDHHATATAIARQIGLIQSPADTQLNGNHAAARKVGIENDYEVIQGDRLSSLTEQDWDALIKKRSLVFSRTTPEQKLLIVEQCQRRNQLLAMTGDGVNDAPALKRADIGIAMGSGSEVAKQAADIILTDDNFSSIVHAVEEGRVMYDNIKKLLGYTMPHSFPEVWPIIVHFCFGFPVGITPLQILSIDLGSELLPGISMSKEPIEGDVMRRPPRSQSKTLVSNTLLFYAYAYIGQLQSLGCFLAYLCVFWFYGISVRDLWMSAMTCWQRGGEIFTTSKGRSFSVDEQLYIQRQACSAWHMGIIFGQVFNVWSARTRRMSLLKQGLFSNKFLIFAVAVEFGLLSCYIYLPGLNTFLGGAPIPWQCWAVVAATGTVLLVFNELRKLTIRRFKGNRIVRYFKW